MIAAKTPVLEELIKPVGFFRRKAKNLQEISQIVLDKYDGDIPRTAEDLMALPGIGPKMAYLAMQHAWNEYQISVSSCAYLIGIRELESMFMSTG